MVRLLLFLGLTLATSVAAAEVRINKVLPHLLDSKGRVALSPSLYERDAYQAHLRQHLAEVSGMRFDVNWKAPLKGTNNVTMRIELRMAHRPDGTPLVLETPVRIPRWGSRWTAVTFDGDSFRREGPVIAWRVTLWQAGQERAVKQSFLW